jgi:hypothetical protein
VEILVSLELLERPVILVLQDIKELLALLEEVILDLLVELDLLV